MKSKNYAQSIFCLIFILLSFKAKAQDKRKLDSLTNIIENTNDNKIKIRALLLKAYLYPPRLLKTAEENILEAEKIAANDNNYEQLVEIYNVHGNITRKVGNNKKSLEIFKKALRAGYNTNKPLYKGLAMANIGAVYGYTAKTDSALYWLNLAYDNFKRVENINKQHLLGVNIMKGNLYNKTGNYKLALEEYDKGLTLYSDDADSKELAVLYNNKANSLLYMNRPSEAIEFQIKALTINEKEQDSVRIANNSLNIGNSFSKIRDHETAKKYHLYALKIAKKTGLNKYDPYYNMNLALDYKAVNQIDSAIIHFNRAIHIAESVDNDSWRAVVYQNYGNFLISQKEYTNAEIHLNKALKIFEQIQNVTEIASVKNSLTTLKIESNKLDEAKTLISSIDSLKSTGYLRPMTHAVANQVAMVYDSINGNTDSLIATYQKQLQLFHSIYDENEKTAVLKAESQYQMQRQKLLYQLEAQKNKQKRNTIIAIAIALATIGTAIIIVMNIRRRQAKAIHLAQLDQLGQEHRLHLARALSEAEQEERKNIAHKLHDEVGNLLSIAKLNVNQLESSHTIHDIGQHTKLQSTSKILTEIVESIRNISHSLMPVALEKFGLKAAIEDLISLVNSTNKIQVEVIIEGIENTTHWPQQLTLTIYRMVNEIINNTLKHAEANTILLQIIEHEKTITIYIEDNGKGFSGDINTHNGKGLTMLKNNIEFLNGTIEISTSPDGGTFVFAEIPVVAGTSNTI